MNCRCGAMDEESCRCWEDGDAEDRLAVVMSRLGRRLSLTALGHWRSFWWGVVRSEAAQRRKIVRDEVAWSGKGLNPEELDELISEQRPRWRRSCWERDDKGAVW